MGFFRQLRYLLWKNFLIRWHQKLWALAELICPLLLFMILVWVRYSDVIEKNPECHYAPKALPSAGFLPFFQSYLCTLKNTCDQEMDDSDIGPANDANHSVLALMGKFVQKYFTQLEFAEKLRNHSNDFMDDLEEFRQIMRSNDMEEVQTEVPIFGLLPAIFTLNLTKADRLGMKIRSLGKNLVVQEFIAIFSEIGRVETESNGDLIKMFTCGKLDNSLEGMFPDKSAAEKLQERFRGKSSLLEMENFQAPPEQSSDWPKNVSEDAVCKDVIAEGSLDIKCQEWLQGSKEGLSKKMVAPFMALLRGFILVTPKPNNTAMNKVLEKLERQLQGFNWFKGVILDFYYNAENYQDALNSSDLANYYSELVAFTNSDVCAQLELKTQGQNVTLNCSELAEQLDPYRYFFVSSDHPNSTFVKWKNIIEPVAKMTECFRTHRFLSYDNVEMLEDRGKCLTDKNLFFAALVFDIEPNATNLPPFVKYQIRMPHYLTGPMATHSKIWVPDPRVDPWMEMHYQTYGFQFLQDAVDRAIIEVQTNRTPNISGYIQQFSSPCYQIDAFINSIERVLPMLMVMAWVCTASLIIKNVVYEKEMRLKEFMKVMGLGNAVHWVAWFITAFIFAIISVLLFTMVINLGRVVIHTNFGVLFFFILSFMVATITQCFLISTFFQRANVAAACGAIIYFLCYLPYWLVIQYAEEMGKPSKLVSCILAQVAFGWGCYFLAYHESSAQGVQWNNIMEEDTKGLRLTLIDVMMMMLVDSGIHLILMWYIETVFPGEYGIPRPFYFLFTKSYWWDSTKSEKSIRDLEELAPEIRKYTESEPTQLPLGVAVRQLKKTYSNGKVALSGVSINFYESQITSFLGHNGAGKTTTLSILTGLFPPTEGTVLVYGNDVRTRIDAIRKSLGMCPQHNILFGSLTVRQQLKFYAGLKGVPYKQIDTEVDQLITELALTPKQHTPTDDLSGGNQRRVAIAAAFIGGSKTVILDEPTAGVDPCARRLIWDLLLRKKEGRTIILSTHFMDEADVLGDRIAIIGAGQLRCCGSSMFLKKCYGSGYRLTMVRKYPAQARLHLTTPELALDKKRSPSVSGKDKMAEPTTSGVKTPEDGRKTTVAPPLEDESARAAVSRDLQASMSSHDQSLRTVLEPSVGSNRSVGSVASGPGVDNDKKIHQFITKSLPGSVLTEDVGHEFTYNVPSDNLEALQEFFVKLEANMKKLSITSYGVSETKLEEIFMKAVGEEVEEKKKQRKCCRPVQKAFKRWRKRRGSTKDDKLAADESSENSEELAREYYIEEGTELIGKSSIFFVTIRHFVALLIKRWLNFRRNIRGFICEIFLPLILIAFSMLILRLQPEDNKPKYLNMTPWYFVEHENYVFKKMDYPFPLKEISVPQDGDIEKEAKLYLESLDEPPGLGVACIKDKHGWPYVWCGELRSDFKLPSEPKPINKECKCSEKSVYECEDGVYQPFPPVSKTNTSDLMINLTSAHNHTHNISRWLIMTEQRYRKKRFGGFSFGEVSTAASNGTLNWTTIGLTVREMNETMGGFSYRMKINWKANYREPFSTFDLYNGSFMDSKMDVINKMKAFMSGLDTRGSVKIWYNNQGYISGPAYASVFSNAILRALVRNMSLGWDDKKFGIFTVNYPMTPTRAELGAETGAYSIGRITFQSCMIMLALCIIPASFVLFIIEETTSFSKHLQYVTGVRPVLYWISNFTWDMCHYMLTVGIIMVLFEIFNEQAYLTSDGNAAVATLVLFILYGFAMIPMMYPFTFAFKVPSLAFIMLSMGHAMIGWMTAMCTMIVEMMGETDPTMKQTNEVLTLGFLIFPTFCLGRGLMDIKKLYFMDQGLKIVESGHQSINRFKWEHVGRNMFCLAIEGCIWFAVTLIIEYWQDAWTMGEKDLTPADPNEDKDVRQERERILMLSKRRRDKDKYALEIKNLSKVFVSGCGANRKLFRAVSNLCVGVRRGECFGLLGVNGAGKTTTFSMVTGKLNVTSGDALINGSSILSNMAEVCHQIGFCPQFDALHPLLTAREELRFYARLRGVKSFLMEKVVSRAIVQLGLKYHADRQAGTYSGGNKRKLSTAISMIGNPAVVLLDEPTTGMDPKARRFLWNRIMEVLRDGKTSIVLTSHSMEECEALCHRIGIMVNGRFQCLGSPQHLKSRFGQGYTLTIKIGGTKPKTGEAIEFVKQRFPGAELKEQHLSQLRFQLPPSIKALSDVFACMVEAVKVLQVDDYTLSQTTLEEVFISFAREQGPGVVSEAKERKRSSAKPS